MKGETQDLNLVIWTGRSLGLCSQHSHCKQGVHLALRSSEFSPIQLSCASLQALMPSLLMCCKTCKITHKGKTEIILMREIFSAYLQGRERIWKKSVPSHLYDSAGHDHSFKDNFKVSKCLWESLNWCLNSNSRYKCKCREDKWVLQGEMLDWPWTWKQSPWYYHRKMLDSKTSLEKQN